MTFDYDRDTKRVERWSKLADAKDPYLSRFRKSGGKLIMTYGWADQILQPLMGVNYYQAVVAKNGKDTTDFARLFMVPGMPHCAGGVGPDRNDAVTAVIDWVEKGKAPDQLIASKVSNGQVWTHAAALPVPAGCTLQGTRQHRRGGQLQLRRAALTRSRFPNPHAQMPGCGAAGFASTVMATADANSPISRLVMFSASPPSTSP